MINNNLNLRVMKTLVKISLGIMVNYMAIVIIYNTFNTSNLPLSGLFKSYYDKFFSPDPLITIATIFSFITLILFNVVLVKSFK
jgi:hypothetical protein